MPQPHDAKCLPPGSDLTLQTKGTYVPSKPLIDLLVKARSDYDWPAGTGAAASQQTIVNLKVSIACRLIDPNAKAANGIVVDVSNWAGNNVSSHAQLVNATPAQKAAMLAAISYLMTPFREVDGINELCALPGISLVIASKIFRFCSPKVGAAVDRHASYFFNSLPINGHGAVTNFTREWSTGHHTSSRLAIYSRCGYTHNLKQYFESYLPILTCIANALNTYPAQYRCASTNKMKNWTPADVEMAAYYWWACNGAR